MSNTSPLTHSSTVQPSFARRENIKGKEGYKGSAKLVSFSRHMHCCSQMLGKIALLVSSHSLCPANVLKVIWNSRGTDVLSQVDSPEHSSGSGPMTQQIINLDEGKQRDCPRAHASQAILDVWLPHKRQGASSSTFLASRPSWPKLTRADSTTFSIPTSSCSMTTSANRVNALVGHMHVS